MINLTLILSTRNENDQRLLKTIETVINLEYQYYHLIIVNDSSKSIDQLITTILARNLVSYEIINNKKQIGLTKSLIKAVNIVNTEYIGRLDAGDRCLPDRFLREIKCMEENPEIGLCACQSNIFIKKGDNFKIAKEKFPANFHPANLYFRNILVHGSIVIRKSTLRLCGGYNTNYDLGQDYEMYLRLMKFSKIILLPYLGYEKYFYENSSTMQRNFRSSSNALRAKINHFPKDNLLLGSLAFFGLIFSILQIIRGLVRR
jgi:glycosyltransferase involved in cell wall biosynthesis